MPTNHTREHEKAQHLVRKLGFVSLNIAAAFQKWFHSGCLRSDREAESVHSRHGYSDFA